MKKVKRFKMNKIKNSQFYRIFSDSIIFGVRDFCIFYDFHEICQIRDFFAFLQNLLAHPVFRYIPLCTASI